MTDPSTVQLVERYNHLEQIRASAVEEQDAIKAQLRAVYDLGKHETPAGTVTVSPNRRFDPTLFEQLLGDNTELVAACSSTILPPAVYLSCMKESPDARVTIA
jgi:hypothetical protein